MDEDIHGKPDEVEDITCRGGYCHRCGTSEGVFKGLDPYLHEMFGDEEEYWLCSDCHTNALGDI